MAPTLHDLLPHARRRWRSTDPVLARAAALPLARRPLGPRSGFESLVTSVAHQQVSIHAGRAIVRRLRDACGGAIRPAAVLALGPERLRAAGLSRPKVAYALDLAARAADGRLDFRRLARATDEEVVATLTEVKGIGEWTAKMFMIFHQHRPDVLAEGDLGLQIAASDLYGVPRARAERKLLAMREAWAPYCSVASLVLWDTRRRAMEAARALA